MESRVLPWLGRKARDGRTAIELYGAIVTQARKQAFFADAGVMDTPEGRIAMIMVHLFLVLDRLIRDGDRGRALAQRLTETFVTDVDDCLREMGVGDLSVPKKVKRAAAALHERCLAYRAALADGEEGRLAAELAATVPGLEPTSAGAAGVAAYVRSAAAHIARLAPAGLFEGRVTFPAPAPFVAQGIGTPAMERLP